MTTQSGHYPGAEYVPVFPVGMAAGAWHGSGLETPSGRFMYVYSVTTRGGVRPEGELRVAFYNDFNKLAHEAEVNEDGIGQFFDGTPDEDLLILGGIKTPVQTLWRHPDGRTFLTISYGTATDDVADDTPDLNVVEIWTSPSGEGTDWVVYSNVQTDAGDGISAFYGPGERVAGAGYITPSGAWLIPVSLWKEGNHLQGIYRSGSGGMGWTKVLEVGFYINGIYGDGQTRAIVGDGAGGLLFTAWSHTVNPVTPEDPFGQWKIAHGDVEGNSWSISADHRPTNNPGFDLPWAPNLLGQAGGEVTRINRAQLEASSFPLTGPWVPVVSLKEGRFDGSSLGQDMLNTGLLWSEVRPGTWVLFSHDKAWFVFGGWLVGALGHS